MMIKLTSAFKIIIYASPWLWMIFWIIDPLRWFPQGHWNMAGAALVYMVFLAFLLIFIVMLIIDSYKILRKWITRK
jgi:hypothetical protein